MASTSAGPGVDPNGFQELSDGLLSVQKYSWQLLRQVSDKDMQHYSNSIIS